MLYKSRVEEQHVFRNVIYSDLVKQIRLVSEVNSTMTVEVGARGFVMTSPYNIYKQLSIKGQARICTLQILTETTEKGSC